MKRIFTSTILFSALILASKADEVISSYQCNIQKQDLYSSSGKRLKMFSEAIQQDRANYHKFKKRDESDTNCEYFTTAKTRATIPALVNASNIQDHKLQSEDGQNEALYKVDIIKTGAGKVKLDFTLLAG